jgi:CRISPR system Cascade subunit CasC
MLKPYTGLPNRDRSNDQKTIFYGGDTRLRISSQCLKHAIRMAANRLDTFNTCNVGDIVAETIKNLHPDATQEYLDSVDKIVRWQLTPKDANKANGKDASNKKDHMFKVCMADIRAFAEYILEEFPLNKKVDDAEIKYSEKEPAKTAAGRLYIKMKNTVCSRAVSPEIAMFGRMSTSDTLRSVDGAVCMNHAFSTNAMNGDIDEFAAVDEWQKKGVVGAGMLGETDINFGEYYHYTGINMLTLMENILCGVDYADMDDVKHRMEAAKDAVIDFIRLYAQTAPVAKQTSMASCPRPDCMYITAGVRVAPVSYENAFANSIKAHDKVDIVTGSVNALIDAINDDTFDTGGYDKKIWVAGKSFGAPDDAERMTLDMCLKEIRRYLDSACG